MGNVNPAYFDRVRYTLYNKAQGSLIITEPIGWTTDEKESARHEQYLGMVSRFSNSSGYIGDGREYIQTVYDTEGIQANLFLKREERHPQTDVWTLTYSGYLDLSTWSTEEKKLSVKFNSGGMEQSLKSRESEQVEIDRTTSMNGIPIDPVNTVTVDLEGRRIFLKSKWEIKAPNDYGNVFVESEDGNVRHNSVGIPYQLVNQSHESAQSVIIQTNANENHGSNGMMFFAVSDRRRILDISLNLTFRLDVNQEDITTAFYNINLTRYGDGINYIPVQRINLFSLPNKAAIFAASGRSSTITWQGQVIVEIGESLAVEALEKVNLGGPGHAELRINLSNATGELKADEDSFFERSTTKAILPHEFFEKLVEITTNKKKAFYSEYFGRRDIGYEKDGPGAYMAVAHGFWIRQFDKLPIPTEGPPKIDNLFKPLTASFKDAFQSYDALTPLGVGIERNGNKERVRLEELKYFFNLNTTIRLPGQVNKVKRSVANQYYYSSLEFGSEKAGDYQEAFGLDEYNTKSTFTTVIDRTTETYSKISKFRYDSYGMEFARRKPRTLNDTEDTAYDTDVFIMDLKPGPFGIFQQRKWQDDFEREPTGVFSPETATNLRFSPVNCLLRHAWWFSGGFKFYPSDYVRYASSGANSRLKTQLIGGLEYAEDGNIMNSELEKARIFPEWVEFEKECTFDINQMVEGSTLLFGKPLLNFYGLVEFTNEKNEIEKGFLFNLKPNGNGSWRILKSSRY